MNAVSLNNLWKYLQGLSLTASNRKWLMEKLAEPVEKHRQRDKGRTLRGFPPTGRGEGRQTTNA